MSLGRFIKYSLLFLGLCWGGKNTLNAQLAVSDNFSYERLVKDVFIGEGVVVSNVTYSGAPLAVGYFDGTYADLGVYKGVLLTTGSIYGLPGPNISTSTSANNNLPGDRDLDALTTAPTFDAAALEYDFVSASDTVTFRYVLGSEEYNEWGVKGLHDVFGVLVSGPGFSKPTNVTLIPQTTLAVSIDNINDSTYTGYYVDNAAGRGVECDGFTVVLTAKIPVKPLEKYHIKLALADVGDHIYDSSLFLEAGSFAASHTAELVADIDAKPIGCNGTTRVDLMVTGGVPPYQYLWSNGITAQDFETDAVGAYSVTIMDAAGNYFFDKVTVKNADGLDILTQITPVSCNAAGSIDLIVSGGVPPYQYSWDNGFVSQDVHNLNVGHYVVTINDASGCKWKETVEVPGPTPMTTTLTHKNATCGSPMGAINLTVKGGAAPYNYYWYSVDDRTFTGAHSEDLENIPEGYYFVDVTDALGCTVTDSVVVGFLSEATPHYADAATAQTLADSTGFCEGGALLLTLDRTYDAYLWSNGETTPSILVSEPGVFFAQVQGKNGCPLSVNPITVHKYPNAVVPTLTVVGDTVYASAAVTYQWSLNGTQIPGANQNYLIMTDMGEYSVATTDANGCSAAASYNKGNVTVRQVNKALSYAVYPNPTHGKLILDAARLSGEEVKIELTNAVGAVVYRQSFYSSVGRFEMQLEHLSGGLYTLRLDSKMGVILHKIIKE